MDTLTYSDVVALGEVCRWAQTGTRVQWLTDGDRVMSGVVRCIGDENGNRLPETIDVREGYLRISATFEHFLPIRVVIDMVNGGRMVVDA